MNLPNKLTILRICMIPLFLLFVFLEVPHRYLWAFVVFGLASLTDMLDGYLARKHNWITDFGKLMDPLADKLLVMSAMVCFVALGWAPAVVVILILAREFLVTSLRLVAAGEGKVIAADIWGKYKTISQMIWICYLLLSHWAVEVGLFAQGTAVLDGILLLIVTGLTLFSGFHYLWSNRYLLKTA